MHDDAPGALCVPAAQFVHVTSAAVVAPGAFVPNLPAAQVAVHAATSILEQPAPLCRPAGQSAQALQESAVAVPPCPVQGQPARLPTWYWPAPHPLNP